MLSDLFELLFKYRPAIFSEGELTLAAPTPMIVGVAIAALLLLPVVLRYRRVGGRATALDRVLLAGLRVAALAVVLLCLLQPSLVLEAVVPQQSFVGVLVDDSRSMQIRDEDGATRGERAARMLTDQTGPLLAPLTERFKVRLFGFSRGLRRVEDVSEVSFGGGRTDLAPALLGVADELASVPLAGMILISDGADNSGGSGELSDVLLELRARSIPVNTVGMGRERFAKDIEISRVVAPRLVLKGSSLLVELTLEQTGFAGSRVVLEAVDSGRLMSTQEVRFPTSGEAVTARVNFAATTAGPRTFTFRVAPQAGEVITENNERVALIEVLDRTEKILYFEGEPRYEVKFLRRAVADDENLQVVTLQRTAENKYLRLDIDDPLELDGGFPTSREDLFKYRGLILGSVEASFFTYDQMRMMVDFVSQRGGGFLMIGGRRAFSEGGYAGTPVADLLPVLLGPASGGEGEPFFSELEVKLTPFGRTHPVTQLAEDEEASAERWQGLPQLHTFNPVTRLKPGATALLTGEGEGLPGQQVVLAHQRFGRGRSLAFTVHDSWLWQMHADIDVDDLTHETLWRQLARWLVSYVPDPVSVTTGADRVPAGEAVAIVADVRDGAHLEVNSARVVARVEQPEGGVVEVPLEWTINQDGRFEAEFVPVESGLHRIAVEAFDGEQALGTAECHFVAAPLGTEFFNAERRTALLERIAEETGGQFYPASEVDRVAEDLSYSEGSGARILEHRDLWDMPVLLLALLLLLSGEWGYRKLRGLA